MAMSGADPGKGVLGGQDPPFGQPQNFKKREKRCACTRMWHILVVNSYPDLPLSEILYLPL